MNYYLKVLNEYTVFNGRARRSEYWYFVLFSIITTVLLTFISIVIGDNRKLLVVLYNLAVFLPTAAVSIRRLHDIGKSGWWWLLYLIPIIGWIWLIILHTIDSNPGENKYGQNPEIENTPTIIRNKYKNIIIILTIIIALIGCIYFYNKNNNIKITSELSNTNSSTATLTLLEFRLLKPALETFTNSTSLTQVDFISTGLTGALLESATLEFDPKTGLPLIALQFNAEGSNLFAKITRENIGHHLGIFVGGALKSLSIIQGEITNGKAIISGFDSKTGVMDARNLVNNLNISIKTN